MMNVRQIQKYFFASFFLGVQSKEGKEGGIWICKYPLTTNQLTHDNLQGER